MKKLSLFSLFVVLALLLAACGGGAEGNQTTPEGGAVGPGVEATGDLGGGTGDEGGVGSTPATGGVVGTATPGVGGAGDTGGGAAQPTATRQPTATAESGTGGTGGAGVTGTPSTGGTGGTGGAATSTPGAGAGGTGGLTTPGVPVTGQVMNVVRGSDLLDFRVEAAGGAGVSGGMQETGTPAVDGDPGGTGDAMQTGTPATGGTGGDTGSALQTGTPATGGDSGGTGGSTQTGEEFGEVEDVILPVMGDTMGMDQTVWLVVAVDETFLDLGPNQLIPVPLRNAQVDETRQVVLLQLDPNMIEQAPSFSSNQWPDMSTPGWDSEFNSFWTNQAGGGTDGDTGGMGGAQQTGTPAAGGAGRMEETGTPAANGSALQTGTPAAGGDTALGASVNFVRLSELLTFQVQSSQVDAGGGDAMQTGTPAAGGTGGMQETGTPAAGGGSPGNGDTSLGTVFGDANDVLIDLGTWDMTGTDSTGGTSGDMAQGSNATVMYLVVSADPSLGFPTDANLVAIPWQLVQSVQPDQQLVLVDADQDQFQGAPGFGEDSWPAMGSETWDQEWEQYWQNSTTQ